MTNEKYRKAYRESTRAFQKELRRQRRILKNIYKSAAAETAQLIKSAELSGKSTLTINSMRAIQTQLEAQAQQISLNIIKRVEDAVTSAHGEYVGIDAEYIYDAAQQAGAGSLITVSGLKNMGVAVNQTLIADLVGRLYSDGKNFSERVWKAAAVYRQSIEQILTGGAAADRDIFKIAQDIQTYVRDGKVALMKRYQGLERGTREFTKRIPSSVDWRAVRLVRSELYHSLQNASQLQGARNPGSSGLYEWLLMPGIQHDCICIEYAETRFFKEGEVPSYPHPNCACRVIPVLKPQGELVADLKAWLSGEAQPDINNWYNNIYVRSQNA